jgi:hypothetical protein
MTITASPQQDSNRKNLSLLISRMNEYKNKLEDREDIYLSPEETIEQDPNQ